VLRQAHGWTSITVKVGLGKSGILDATFSFSSFRSERCMNLWRSVLLVVGVAVLGVSHVAGQSPAASKTLYERLGGMPAITAVASGLVDRILADTRVNAWFAHAAASPQEAARYKASLADFVCQNVGGPCKYAGPDMVSAHKGRRVTSGAFDAVVQDLTAVLDELKVPAAEKTELLSALAPLKSQIVQK
jgi:hemoglobin